VASDRWIRCLCVAALLVGSSAALARGPQRVVEDFEAFVAKIHRALPATTIIFISIKPASGRECGPSLWG